MAKFLVIAGNLQSGEIKNEIFCGKSESVEFEEFLDEFANEWPMERQMIHYGICSERGRVFWAQYDLEIHSTQEAFRDFEIAFNQKIDEEKDCFFGRLLYQP